MVLNEKHAYLQTQPAPNQDDLNKYYESEEYISHTDSKKGVMAFLYQTIKKRSLKKKVRLITKHNSGKGTLLDIGAGTGDFLLTAQAAGWDISGMEPNPKAIAQAALKNMKLEESLSRFKGRTFDVVTLWHVLEHLPNLEEQISTIESLVRPGGTLLVAVPNYLSYDARFYKKYWAAYDVPRHLWHFSPLSMTKIFSNQIRLTETKPMIFDSFYVSLLSEKYKTGNNFSLRGICVGALSNMKAMFSKNYSSLIYCLKRTK